MDLRPVTLVGLLACGLAAGCNHIPWMNNDFDSLLADGPRTAARPFPNAAPLQQSGKPIVTEGQPEARGETNKVTATAPQAAPTLSQIRNGSHNAGSLTNVPPGRIAPQSATQITPPPQQSITDEPQPETVVVTPTEDPPVAQIDRGQTTAESERLIAEVAALLQQDQRSLFAEEKTFPPHWNQPLTEAKLQREIQLASSEEPVEPPVRPTKKAARRTVEEPAEESGEEPQEPRSPSTDDLSARVEQLRGEMIDALESLVHKSKGKLPKEELARLEQELRLAYLAAGRLDDSVKKIDSLPESPREAFKHLAFALAQMMPEEDDRRPSHRYARTLRSLRDASQELSAAGRLELKNLAFCESVEQFGWYHEFKRREFTPGQQMLLYVEVENVTSERKSPQQFETELQGSYQIFNAANQLVGERKLPLDKETCRNWRRDYFLAYRIYLPEELPPGAYRLELSIEDLKAKSTTGKKLGEGLLDFTVR